MKTLHKIQNLIIAAYFIAAFTVSYLLTVNF